MRAARRRRVRWRGSRMYRARCGTRGLRAMAQERPGRIERRLSAIMAADVAGYSRLMHNDEEATHAGLTALLADIVEPVIAEHGGHIVKNTGDGVLGGVSERGRGGSNCDAVPEPYP